MNLNVQRILRVSIRLNEFDSLLHCRYFFCLVVRDFGIKLFFEGHDELDEVDNKLAWFRQVLEWQQETVEPDEFMEFLRVDLFQDEIFVFTPNGDVIQLPKGATPIDFGFAVHTQVGLHTQGARVNGRLVPLSRELRNSETVEIIRSPNARPSRDWLSHVRTGRARHRIRQWLRAEEQKTFITVGQIGRAHV